MLGISLVYSRTWVESQTNVETALSDGQDFGQKKTNLFRCVPRSGERQASHTSRQVFHVPNLCLIYHVPLRPDWVPPIPTPTIRYARPQWRRHILESNLCRRQRKWQCAGHVTMSILVPSDPSGTIGGSRSSFFHGIAQLSDA